MNTTHFIRDNPYDKVRWPEMKEYFNWLAEQCDSTYKYVHKVYYEIQRSNRLEKIKEPEKKQGKSTWEESSDSASFEYKGYRSLRTLDEALEFCNADLNKWEVDRWVFNSWDVTMKDSDKKPITATNYQVKIWFKLRVNEMTPSEWIAELEKRSKPFRVKEKPGTGVGVFKLADFHMGAYISSLLLTPDFNFNVITSYLDRISNYINSRGYQEVYISLLGDFIESFTGLNHKDSWKGLSKNAFGIKVIKLAHNVLRDHLYSKVNNLKWVGFVSGNHDRTSEKSDGDQEGGAAEALQWVFEMDCPHIDSEWNPILISKVIDGICYIDTHGHLGLVKSDIASIVFKYGSQDHFNIFSKGHKHTREQKRRWVQTLYKINNQEVVGFDESKWRAFTIPPLFTGNFYSQSNDWNGTAGFVEFYNNGNGYPISVDYTL